MPFNDATPAGNSSPAGPFIQFSSGEIVPPAAVYVSPQDQIQVWVRNPDQSATIHVHYRLITPNGELTPNLKSFTCQSTGTAPFVFTIPPAEGFLLSLVIFAPTISRGQVFVKVFLVPGSNTDEQVLAHMLVQGYVSDDDRLAFPTSRSESSLQSPGWLREIVLGQQPIGTSSVSQVVPAGVHWLIRALVMQAFTGGAAHNTALLVEIFDPTPTLGPVIISPSIIPTSSNAQCTWAPGLTTSSVTSPATNAIIQNAGLPEQFTLPPGWKVTFILNNGGASDQIVVATLLVEEFVGQ